MAALLALHYFPQAPALIRLPNKLVSSLTFAVPLPAGSALSLDYGLLCDPADVAGVSLEKKADEI